MSRKLKQPYCPHDLDTGFDEKIMRLEFKWGMEGSGIFWRIIETMHKNDFRPEDEEVFCWRWRIEREKCRSVLNDFGLFRLENGYYISDRVLRNLDFVEENKKDRTSSAKARWIVSSFDKYYEEIFGEKPALNSSEIDTLKSYNDKIPDLKEKLRDIIYTLRYLKFKNIPEFKPCANWLLKNNNLARLYNGEFGELKHKKTDEEIKQEQALIEQQEQEIKEQETTELNIRNNITTKTEALYFLLSKYKSSRFIPPPDKEFMKKWKITESEFDNERKNLIGNRTANEPDGSRFAPDYANCRSG